MKKDFNINSDLLKKVTNLDVDHFTYTDNGKDYDVSGLVEIERNTTGMMNAITLYSCELKTGKVSANVCNLQCENTEALQFARQVSAFWYLVKGSEVKEAADLLVEKWDSVTDEFIEARSVYKARIESAAKICALGFEGFKLADICQAARNTALFFLGARVDNYPLEVRQVAGAIYDELIRLDAIMPDVKPLPDGVDDDGHDFNVANVKELRRLLVKFAVAFFPWDDNGVIKKYRYRASDARARNLYRLAAKIDRSTGRNGDVTIAQKRALMDVIIGQVLGAVQYVPPKAEGGAIVK